MDQNELLRKLAAQAGVDAALKRLSAQHTDELKQAARAA